MGRPTFRAAARRHAAAASHAPTAAHAAAARLAATLSATRRPAAAGHAAAGISSTSARRVAESRPGSSAAFQSLGTIVSTSRRATAATADRRPLAGTAGHRAPARHSATGRAATRRLADATASAAGDEPVGATFCCTPNATAAHGRRLARSACDATAGRKPMAGAAERAARLSDSTGNARAAFHWQTELGAAWHSLTVSFAARASAGFATAHAATTSSSSAYSQATAIDAAERRAGPDGVPSATARCGQAPASAADWTDTRCD
jgi:hypothetical protein